MGAYSRRRIQLGLKLKSRNICFNFPELFRRKFLAALQRGNDLVVDLRRIASRNI
jgi:hypothetical protein